MTDRVSPVPGPRPSLAGLAAEVADLRRTLEVLTDLPAQVRGLADVVAALTDQAGGRPSGRSGPAGTVPSWLALSADFAETVTVLGELVAWMGEVYLRYADAAGLPECWLWHPDVVEELLWLRGTWLEAYAADGPTVARAGDWHDRQRPGVVRRIRATAGTCSLEAHQPGGDRHHGAEPVPLAEAIHLIGEWWSTNRQACAPAPDAGHINAATELRRRRGRR